MKEKEHNLRKILKQYSNQNKGPVQYKLDLSKKDSYPIYKGYDEAVGNELVQPGIKILPVNNADCISGDWELTVFHNEISYDAIISLDENGLINAIDCREELK